jgi:hypothetical protein
MAANLTMMKANMTAMEANMTATAFLLKETKSNLTVIERWLKLAAGPEAGENLNDLAGFLRKGVRDKGDTVLAYDTVEDQNYVNEILNSLYSIDSFTVETERVEVDYIGAPDPKGVEISQNKNMDSGTISGEEVEENKKGDLDLKGGKGSNPKDISLDSIASEVQDDEDNMIVNDHKGLAAEEKVKSQRLMDQTREAKGNKKDGDTEQMRSDDNMKEDLVNPKLVSVDNIEGGKNVPEEKNKSDNISSKGEVKNYEVEPAKEKIAENDKEKKTAKD